MAAFIGGKRLSICTQSLTPQLRRRAAEELGEDEDSKKMGVFLLKKMIEESEGVPVTFGDDFLLMMLRARKYDIHRALELSVNCLKFIRSTFVAKGVKSAEALEEIFSLAKKLRNIGLFGYIPQRDDDGCIVFIYRISNWDPEEITFDDHLIAIIAGLIAINRFGATQIAGLKTIIDYRGLSMKHMKYIPVKEVKRIGKLTQNFLPARFKEIHILSDSPYFFALWKMLNLMLPNKIKSRVHMHTGDLSTLCDFISPSILPEYLSGTCTHLDTKRLDQQLEDSRHVVEEILTYALKCGTKKK